MKKLLSWVRCVIRWIVKICAVIFVHPASRILFAISLVIVLTLGALLSNDATFGYGWLPGWYSNAYLGIAAALSAQPFIAGITDAVTKRRIKNAIRDGLDDGLGKFVERIRDIARITTGTGWSNEQARAFERSAMEALQHLFILAGIPEPRVCFYAISTTDETEIDATGNPVVQQLTYVHHFPKQRPTAVFLRNSSESKGMFEALDTGQPSFVEDREDYEEDKSHWRSALRVPVQHEKFRWGVLTLDSPRKKAATNSYADILGFGAALIGLARLCEDSKEGPTDEQITHVFSNFG